MPLYLTVILLALTVGVTAFAGWRGSRPPDIMRGPRMAPWPFIMLVGLTLGIFLLIHLLNLAGIHTGPPTDAY